MLENGEFFSILKALDFREPQTWLWAVCLIRSNETSDRCSKTVRVRDGRMWCEFCRKMENWMSMMEYGLQNANKMFFKTYIRFCKFHFSVVVFVHLQNKKKTKSSIRYKIVQVLHWHIFWPESEVLGGENRLFYLRWKNKTLRNILK